MKKEKWIVKEIEKWQSEEIIDEKTACTLKERYTPTKSLNMLIILFSVIGTLFIGTGVILIGAHNLWYSLSVGVRTVIAFLPVIASQVLVFYVHRQKMHSVAFREGAAILNMAGVFASIAIVSQIFHLSGDFTSYILVCGVLSFPSMIFMKAAAPLAVFYWTVLNGGPFIESDYAILVTVLLFTLGAVYAMQSFKEENGKAVYLSWISVIGAFILMFMVASDNAEWMTVFLVFFAFLLTLSERWEKAGTALKTAGGLGMPVMLAIGTYGFCWEYKGEWEGVTSAAVVAVMGIIFIVNVARSIKERNTNIFTYVLPFAIALRLIWLGFGLEGAIAGLVFSVIFNVLMFAIGVVLIAHGVKNTQIFSANAGMVTVCTLIVLRFFDSGMSLGLRGVVFLLVGIGFLLFNMRLVRDKKAKERGI